jgi:hypothetical protein
MNIQFRRERDHNNPLERRDAAPRPGSFNRAALTVEAVIATNADVRRRDARGEFIERLDVNGADLSALRGASVLDSHERAGIGSVIGTIDEARVDGNEIVARIRFSARAEVAPIVDDVEAGILRSVSVGYEVAEWRDGTDPSTGLRTRTATKWTPREVSFVAIPADPNARTRLADPTGRVAINREIRVLGARAGMAVASIDDLIDRGVTLEAANTAILADMMARSAVHIRSSNNNNATLDNPEVRVRAMSEALYTRIAPNFRASAEARQFMGLTIPEMARECLRRAGHTIQSLGAAEIITRALHTTSDFALVLGDVLHKSLRDAYTVAPSGIRRLARETTAVDFRKKSRIMLDSSGLTLEKVNEHGEFRSTTMTEAAESYRVDTFGRIFGISRQALVNDDLGAFADVTRRLGLAAASFEAQFLVDLLTVQSGVGPDMADDAPLFDASHGNKSVAGAAPSETTLNDARLAMRKQTGPSGGLIVVEPAYVVVPPELETATEKLLTSIQPVVIDNVNVFSRLKLIVEPRFKDAFRWYVVADPASVDGLEYAYLAGSPGPQTFTRLGFEIDGVETKVRLDYGGGFVDWRGWYTNAGH